MSVAFTVNTVLASAIVLKPPASAKGDDIGIVFIQGALCNNKAYTKLATEMQNELASQNIRAWFGLPDFVGHMPEPLQVGSVVADGKKSLKAAGFSGSDFYVAAHSLGVGIIQNYTVKHPTEFLGQIFMGGSLIRTMRQNDNSTGLTDIVHPNPTLVLAGTKDGLYRITRNAESYWHQVQNISPHQKGQYPVVLMKGLSHASFMDDSMMPLPVKDQDLKADVSQAAGYKMVAVNAASFILKLRGKHAEAQAVLGDFQDESASFFKPMIDAMFLEGSYNIKIPCYNKGLVNPTTPKECMSGSPWVTKAQIMMGGDTSDEKDTVDTFDNFHRVYVTTPHHLP